MSGQETKPSYNAGRRIRRLMILVVVLAAAYSAGWYWMAAQVDAAVSQAANDQNAALKWTCPGQSVRGYPFRIGVFCDRLQLETDDGQLSVSGGAVRSAAQVYSPRRIVAEFDAPVTVLDAAGTRYALNWDRARSNMVTAPVAERMVGFEAEQATLTIDGMGTIATTDRLGLYVRENADALDIAARPRSLALDPRLTFDRALPVIGLDIDVRLEEWQSTWATGPTPAGKGSVNRLAVLLSDDSGVIVEGPFTLSPSGQISGEFAVRVVDVPEVLAAGRDAFPEIAPQLEALAAATPRQEGEPEDEFSLSLTVREGRVSAGFIPLGRIPALPLGAFSAL